MAFVLALGASYLLGAIPTALLLVKWIKRIDIRTVGSGNIGATNALRVAGPWAGAVALLVDVLKGFLAVTLLPRLMLGDPSGLARLGCGLAAVVGHDFSCFAQFRGGKGVATTIGVILGTMPLVGLTCVAVWGIVMAIWRYVSVASLASAASLPIAAVLMGRVLGEILLGAALALFIIIRHRANIQRLLSGAEHRVGWSQH